MKVYAKMRSFPWNIIILGSLFVISRGLLLYNTQDSVSFKVVKAERVVDGGGENTRARYLIFTTTETFEKTDELLFGKFDSSDVYGSIEIGSTYEAKVVGVRVPFLSWYRNILSVKKI